jgi:hypothetical protein
MELEQRFSVIPYCGMFAVFDREHKRVVVGPRSDEVCQRKRQALMRHQAASASRASAS